MHPVSNSPDSSPIGKHSYSRDLPSEVPTELSVSEARDYSKHGLSQTLESLGNKFGITVRQLREIPKDVQDKAQELRGRFQMIRGNAMENAKCRSQYLANTASRQAQTAVRRADRFAHEKPLHFIAGAAALGAILGFALRLGRSHE